MKFSTFLAFVGALPLLASDRKKSLGAVLLALHESRRRQARASSIRRYRHLIDRRDTPADTQGAPGVRIGQRHGRPLPRRTHHIAQQHRSVPMP